MPRVKANGIDIEYDTFGDPSSSPLLLIMGLGSQMVRWEEDFCNMLVERGHYVVRFDNRDVGLSSKFDEAGVPNVIEIMKAVAKGEEVEVPYTVDDMADDSAGLLEALGIETAHVCGISMGGMIAQAMAIRHPSRMRSMISIMSSTGNPELPKAKPEALAVLMTPAPAERDAYLEHSVKLRRIIGSPGFAFDEEVVKKDAARSYDRCFYPQGAARQLAGISAHGNRKLALASVTVPTLVIHGAADPLVPVEGGKDTAEAIPGAKLSIIEGMGHSLPIELWPRLADEIAAHAKEADGE